MKEGNVTRGRLGVQVTPVTKDLMHPLGLKEPGGALVRIVERGGPAAAAGIEAGDVIVRYNSQDVENSRELVGLVTRTKPGTTVPVEIVRDGQRRTVQVNIERLELDDMAGGAGAGALETAFGISLEELTQQMRNQLKVPSGRGGAIVARVERGSAAARSGVRAGDVVLDVNRAAVTSVEAAAAALREVGEGQVGFLLVWRDGQELFLTLTPER
jgi:serine protease Do